MIDDIDYDINNLEDMYDELLNILRFEQRVKKDIQTLENNYQKGLMDFEKYSKIKKEILTRKTYSDEMDEFSCNIINIIDRMQKLNKNIAKKIYSDISIDKIKFEKKQKIGMIDDLKHDLENKKISGIVEKIDGIDDDKLHSISKAFRKESEKLIEKREYFKKDISKKIKEKELIKIRLKRLIKETEKKFSELDSIQQKLSKIDKIKQKREAEKRIKRKKELIDSITKKAKEINLLNVKLQEIIKNQEEISHTKLEKDDKIIPEIGKIAEKLIDIENEDIKEKKKAEEKESKIVDDIKSKTEKILNIKNPKKISKPVILKAETKDIHPDIKKTIDEHAPKKRSNLDILKEEAKKNKDIKSIFKIRSKDKKDKGIFDNFFKKKEKTILEQINEDKTKQKRSAEADRKRSVEFKGIMNFGILKKLFSDDEKVIGKKTSTAHSLLDMKDIITDDSLDLGDDKGIDFLKEESSQMKELLKKTDLKVYNASSIGHLANFFVRKITIMLLDNFPNIFKKFYISIRMANIKFLSNTYVNIMIFFSIIGSFFLTSILTPVYIILDDKLNLIIFKTITTLIMSFFGIIFAFYYYPQQKIKKRRKSMNTNLPFAIDQMSSVASSGVAPGTMFKLIAKTKEYGEVSVEIEKISNLISVFGYDAISAIRNVASNTPSDRLKEFFDGFVSTIESGGSLKDFLSQKSKEALVAYQLERQKYTQSISTYSDIYTGLLIAAPLFFISTLSVVSVLGGKVGGMEVGTLMSLGTYLIIPLLNISFIIFLEVNQPEI